MTRRPPSNSSQREQIAELREQRGWSHRRIALHLGLSPGAVSWYCLIDGIEKAGPARAPTDQRAGPMVRIRGSFQVRLFSADDDDQLRALEAEGLGYSEIGRRLGRQPNSIRGRLATVARREERAVAWASEASRVGDSFARSVDLPGDRHGP